MCVALLLTFIIAFFSICCIFSRDSSLRGIPWGYRGIYGVGLLPYFKGSNCRKKLIQIGESGKICLVRMGSFTCVWLNDYYIIKEAWSNSKFCGRPHLEGISIRTKGVQGGIIFNNGREFTEQRKFAMATLTAAGFGKGLCHQYIHEEMKLLMVTLKRNCNTPISTRHLFNIPVFNIIWRCITGGSRFQPNDPVMVKLVDLLNRNMELSDGSCAAFFMPWLSRFLPRLTGWNNYAEDSTYLFQFWSDFASKVVKNADAYPSTSFLHAYCKKVLSCKESSSSFYSTKGVTSLGIVLHDLFIAGSETTATTLQWICLYLASFPDCQRKIYDEILWENGGSIGGIRQCDMPFTCAFIKESLRFSTLAPLGMLHATTEDVHFHGHFIPKGTLVQMNMCAVHFDKNAWQEPYKFLPERFLKCENGETKLITGEIPGFLPFSLGKRSCPGVEVAKDSLLTATVYIVANFEVSSLEKLCRVQLEPKIGVSAVPYPHKLIFKERNQ